MHHTKLHQLWDWAAVGIIVFSILTCWIWVRGAEAVTPYASILVFAALSILFFNHINLWEQLKKKDTELYLLLFACVLSTINLIIVRSHAGAIFTIVDFLLLLYLADKIDLSDGCIAFITFSCSAVSLFWLLIKRVSYGNCDYNTNGASCIIFTVTMLSLCGMLYLLQRKGKNPIRWNWFFGFVLLVLCVQVFRLKARCVLLGIVTSAVTYYLLPKKPWTIYALLIGSIAFPIVYILLWKQGIDFTIPFTQKSLFSGRERIWPEFFAAFLKQPITGIGSDFEKIVPRPVIYEIHHALLDLLFVHGIPVFLICIYLFIKRLRGILQSSLSPLPSLAVTGTAVLYGMMVIGIMENYYITAPYSAVFFLIMVIMYQGRMCYPKENCHETEASLLRAFASSEE